MSVVGRYIHWRHRPLEEVRAIRDQVEHHVEELLAQRIDAIRADRTAHQLRPACLLPDLVQEFGRARSDGEIRACADAGRTTPLRGESGVLPDFCSLCGQNPGRTRPIGRSPTSRCASAILSEYDEAPLRSFVMTLAHRRTRECLAAETCEPLVTA